MNTGGGYDFPSILDEGLFVGDRIPDVSLAADPLPSGSSRVRASMLSLPDSRLNGYDQD